MEHPKGAAEMTDEKCPGCGVVSGPCEHMPGDTECKSAQISNLKIQAALDEVFYSTLKAAAAAAKRGPCPKK